MVRTLRSADAAAGPAVEAGRLNAKHLSNLVVGITPDPRTSTVRRIADAFAVEMSALSGDQLSSAELRRELRRGALDRAVARGLRRDPSFEAHVESEEAPVSGGNGTSRSVPC